MTEYAKPTQSNAQQTAPAIARSDDGAIPFWMDVNGIKVFAWYHPAQGQEKQNQAIVLCNTFGSEAMVLHPAYRQLAIDLAARGYPCLRFDYPGTGDSEGSPRTPELLASWLGSIHHAIDFLRKESGVARVSLFGILLGATLAAHAASLRDDIDSLLLWAPYISGKKFLRTVKLQNSVITANTENILPADWCDGDSEAFGFLLTKEFSEALGTINLNKISKAPCKQAYLFARDSSSNEGKLAKTLSELNTELTFEDTAVEDLSTITADMQIPTAVNHKIISWLHDKEKQKSTKTTLGSNTPIPLEQQYSTDAYSEEAVFLDHHEKLFSIITHPPKEIGNSTGIVLVNGGSNHRVGINRNYTEWAQGWAAQGYTVTRMDICGLGDTPPQKGQARNTLYLDSTLEEVRVNVEHLRNTLGLQKIVVAGLCGGAYQSLKFALSSKKIDAILLINPLRFQKPLKLEDGKNTHNSVQQLIATTSFLAFALFLINYKNWNTLKGWGRTGLSLVKHACLQLLQQLKDLAQPKKWGTLGRYNLAIKEIVTLTERKIHVYILCSSTEVILPFFKAALARYRRKLTKTSYFIMEELDSTNHILSPIWSQKKAYEQLSKQLKIVVERKK